MESYQRSPAMLPKSFLLEKAAFDAAADPSEVGGAADDRRREPRIPYEQRVMAHDHEASRILIGRDIAVGGLRVDPHPELKVGKSMRVAIHLGEGSEPVSLRARVLRDDGALGVALRFVDVSMSAAEQLRKLVNGNSRLEVASEHGEVEIVLTEILPE
jgi:hypothetical protein